jgi:ABC-2 type transport system permease protein
MYIEQVLADKMEKINLANLDLTKEEVLQIRPSITLDDRLINAEDGDQQAHTLASTGIAYFMGFLTYIVLLIYGSMVMRGVMEEKNNRIVEVMISTVKPFQLMLGKIIGIGAVGLTQFSIWGILLTIIQLVLVVFIGDAFQAMPGSTGQETQQVDMQQMAQMVEGFATIDFGYLGMVFLVFFLGGYFLYASLFAAIGSLVSDDDSGEVQMYSFPLTMLILISIFIATAVIQQPNSSLAFWASIIPFSSPIVMPALIPFGIPAWHLALSITLLITGFICTAWLAGRVYRTGILMYGKKIRFREILRWVIHRS